MTTEHTRTILLISGMQSSRCRERIVAALEAVSGVKEVELNLYRARAVIVHDLRSIPTDLVGAVERAGYRAAVHGMARAPHAASQETRNSPPTARLR
jgi:copper chaperone CopZ